uniref:Ribonuclease H protein At1g65750 family n=1 Tax=Cajanus cajan TaxID=3821 RepID=A0A151T3Y0_CAJCA|nr:Putative ribonuclease H protein At1g65750 family [Cajanus cajan]
MWFIWCHRNRHIFDQVDWNLTSILAQANALLQFSVSAFTSIDCSHRPLPRLVHWIHPLVDSVALNVDGSRIGTPGRGGYGGLCQNHEGQFLFGFYGFLGEASVLQTEILALLHGLHLCWDKGFRKIVCYSDSTLVVSLLQGPILMFHRYGNQLMEIHQLLNCDWTCTVVHTLCEGNSCADALARMGALGNDRVVILQEHPMTLSSLLLADSLGTVFQRG